MAYFKIITLTVLVALVSNISAFAYDFKVNGICYNVLSQRNLTCEVTYNVKYVDSNYYVGVVIPSSVTYEEKTYKVTSIGDYAFYNCSALTLINIPNSVTSIGESAFEKCHNLTSINIPNSVTEIGEKAFYGCSSLTAIKIPDGVTSIGNSAIRGCRDLTSITIPNSVTEIGEKAFNGCIGLITINIPNSVTSIGYGAFEDCSGLTAINIPNSVTSIGSYAFSRCSGLTSVIIGNSVTSIGSDTFSGCSGLTSVIIGNSVKSIGYYAFCGCSSLTSINIPNSVTSIGYRAFYGCSSLTSINIPNSVTSIGYYAFEECRGITSINIPNSVTKIGDGTFSDCIRLTSITIPNSITSIGDGAFQHCGGLKEITSLNIAPPSIYNSTFEGVSKPECILKVPDEAVDDYNAADYWKEFNKIVPLETEYILTDGEEYARKRTLENCTVNYARNFTSDAWQALYVPFEMSYEDWKDYADVAYINNVHQWDDDNDGVIDRTVLEFITKKSGSIEANKPYVIRPKQTGGVTFTSKNTTLYAAPETDGYVDCRSTTTEYTLYGTYQEKTDMYEKGYYAMADGGFKQAESASVTLSPFRTYLKIENRTGAGTVQNAKRISIMVDGVVDNDATGIQDILQSDDNGNENVYNLSGQKVNRSYKGIAIKNGKKYIIK